MSGPSQHRTVEILGVPVACATYTSALEESVRLARSGRPSAVSACNTHLVSHARHSPEFMRVMRRFDLVLPDGMPLKWILNRHGSGLEDRVYGPYFMRFAIERAPEDCSHFFFGGRQETLDRLVASVRALRPDARIAGAYSPPYGEWTEEQNRDCIDRIAASGARFVWVALGGVRQETWIARNLHRLPPAVFFAVGDAFELLAGNRPFAPAWIQRAGLTWFYRLLQEPGRLWLRYFKHNTLFLLQLAAQRIGPSPKRPLPPEGRTRIAFLGLRGVPARYAGFETVVDELGARLAARGHEVTVYNRSHAYPDRPETHRGMRLITFPTVRTKNFETILHSLIAALHACLQPYEIVYLCGVGNACLAALLRLSGKKLIINVDGIDYKRSKWRGFARWWLWRSERWALTLADRLIADNLQVVEHYRQAHGYEPVYISYGSNTEIPPADAGMLRKLGLTPRRYLLVVSRLSPENEVDLVVRAHRDARTGLPLVVVGPAGYERAYFRQLQQLAAPDVHFVGAQYGDGYRELSQNALLFVLPGAIEATRLVLLDQMGFGSAILFREFRATREVIGDAGESFSLEDPLPSLTRKLSELAADPARCSELGTRARTRARELYSWDRVTDQYEGLLDGLLGISGSGHEPAPARESAPA